MQAGRLSGRVCAMGASSGVVPGSYKKMFMKVFATVGLLVISNVFMTFAWYGHLKFKEMDRFSNWGLPAIILVSWGIALFEYCFQVPANRIGVAGNSGPFNLWQLKVLQEVITLVVFTMFTTVVFKNETFRINHFIGFVFLTLAGDFIFKK
jgi:uncharacterized protein (DUF486 family)